MVNSIYTRLSTLIGAYAAILACSMQASAQPQASALQLQYDAPDECPTRSAVEAAALRLAGQMPRAPVVASVYIEHTDNGYRAHVRTHAGTRQRMLEDTSCASVAEAVQVLLALTIDPEAPVGGTATLSTPSADAPEHDPATPINHARSQAQPAAINEMRASAYRDATEVTSAEPDGAHKPSAILSALVGIESGAMPDVAEVGTVGLSVPVFARWRLTERGHLWRDSSQTLPGTSAGGAFALWTLGSGACLMTTVATPATAVCVGLEAGRLSGSSYGVRRNGSGNSLWLAPFTGLQASVPASRFVSLVLDAELAVPLVRRGFNLQDVGAAESSQIHKPSALSARINIGLSLNL
jgi:hypothetical protein